MEFGELLIPQYPWELMIRGTVMYLAVYAMLRLVSRRELGETGAANVLLIVLIADAAQNGMAGQHITIGDGLILIATILAWSVALDAASYRWRWAARLINPPAVQLVNRGRIVPRNLRRELMTEEGLWSLLRERGVRQLDEVVEARLESDGRFSVLTWR